MILFKIIHNDHVESWKEFRLTGSFKHGARWNLPGVPAMYTSIGIQNAMLEAAVYHETPRVINEHFTIVAFETAELRLHKLDFNELPNDWCNLEHKEEVRRKGSEYLLSKEYDGIIVPSATLNENVAIHPVNSIRDCAYRNVVINPSTITPDGIKMIDKFSPIFSPKTFVERDS